MLTFYKIKLLTKSKHILLSKRLLKDFLKKDVKDIFLDEELRGDNSLSDMDESLKEDKEFLKEYIRLNPRDFHELSEEDKDSEEICNSLVGSNCYGKKYIGNKLKNNKEYAKKLISLDGHFLDCFSLDIKDDEDIVKIAINKNPEAIKYASLRLSNNFELGQLAISLNAFCYKLIGDDLKKNKKIALILKNHKDGENILKNYLPKELEYLKESKDIFKQLENEILNEHLSNDLKVNSVVEKKIIKV